MVKQIISAKQGMKLSPSHIQLMKLIQIPTSLIDQRIKEELEENPALEEGDDDKYEELNMRDDDQSEDYDDHDFDNDLPELHDSFDSLDYLDRYMGSDDGPSYAYDIDNGQEEDTREQRTATESSFHEFLEEQVGLLKIDNVRLQTIALQIVGSIDDDGYLRREISAIVDDLLFAQNISATVEELEMMLDKIQRFDPPGIGCRNLQECLYLQLQHRAEQGVDDATHAFNIQNAMTILKEYFEEFSKKHYPRLQRQLGINEKQLKNAVDIILKLNPKPASGYGSVNKGTMGYIVPDFTIINRDGVLELTLNNRNEPELRVSEQYKDMYQDYKAVKGTERASRTQRDAMDFLKNKIQSANWFIDAIKQRNATMHDTMDCIMKYQKQYFLTGDEKKLRPMILKDIAELTNLDISTISRVANSKYVQTEFGTRKLKDFFSEALQNGDGDEVSTLEVKNILSEIIKDESVRKPHSDEKLKSLLQKKGYNIARRTVAKYREQLNIPVARMRKKL